MKKNINTFIMAVVLCCGQYIFSLEKAAMQKLKVELQRRISTVEQMEIEAKRILKGVIQKIEEKIKVAEETIKFQTQRKQRLEKGRLRVDNEIKRLLAEGVEKGDNRIKRLRRELWPIHGAEMLIQKAERDLKKAKAEERAGIKMAEINRIIEEAERTVAGE